MEKIVGIKPPDNAQTEQWIGQLVSRYSGLFECIEIGKSIMGRSIYGLMIGSRKSPVLYCGGMQGREWITSLVLLQLTEDILKAYAFHRRICDVDIAKLLSANGAMIVPSVNPDGAELSINGISAGLSEQAGTGLIESCKERELSEKWRSNARGVDICRNFNAAWDEMRCDSLERGIRGPSIDGWGGEYPESEPETRALVKLCDDFGFRYAAQLCSEREGIAWGYRSFTPPKARLMAKLLSTASGYPLKEPDITNAGLNGWFMQTYNRPAFLLNIGRGGCPASLSGFRFLYSRLLEMLVLGLAM